MGNFVKVGTKGDVAPGRPLIHDFDYDTVVIFQIGDNYFCLEDVCSHQEVALSDGNVDDQLCRVECPMHGSWFDLKDGNALNLPAVKAVRTFAVKVENDDLFVEEPEDEW